MKTILNILIDPKSPLFVSTNADTHDIPITIRDTGCINVAETATSPSKIAPIIDIKKMALLGTLKVASINNANIMLSINTSQIVGKSSSFVNNAS